MPSIEQFGQQDKAAQIYSNESYDKILSTFFRNDADQSVISRASRAAVSIKSNESYNSALNGMTSGTYSVTAGSDISAIFYPYQTTTSLSGVPCFYKNAHTSSRTISGCVPNNWDTLPVLWNKDEDTTVRHRWLSSSGDAIYNVLSSTEFRGDPEPFRDISNIRGIGFRFPSMGIGWGYTTDGRPWPSGNWNNIPLSGFKMGATSGPHGWMVDPIDYVAAPIDFRYDRRRNVWTTERGFWAEITGFSGTVDSGTNTVGNVFYSWKEKVVSDKAKGVFNGTLFDDASGEWARFGTFFKDQAFEANSNEGVSRGTIVWMKINERTDQYEFDCGLTNEQSSDRFNYNKAGIVWDWNIVDWTVGKLFIVGQVVQHKQTASQYQCVQKHISSNGSQPPNPLYWTAVEYKGVSTTLPVVTSDGTSLNAKFYFDSHGHLNRIESSEANSSSDNSTNGSGSSQSCCPPGYKWVKVVTDVDCNPDTGGLAVTYTEICVPCQRTPQS